MARWELYSGAGGMAALLCLAATLVAGLATVPFLFVRRSMQRRHLPRNAGFWVAMAVVAVLAACVLASALVAIGPSYDCWISPVGDEVLASVVLCTAWLAGETACRYRVRESFSSAAFVLLGLLYLGAVVGAVYARAELVEAVAASVR